MKSSLLKFRVDPREIHFIRFIVEACDGLAVVRTLDPATGLISLSVPPGREEEADGVLRSLGETVFMDRMERDTVVG